MLFRRILIIIFFSITCSNIYSINSVNRIDSLNNLLNRVDSASRKIELLMEISTFQRENGLYGESISSALKALNYANLIEDESNVAVIYKFIGVSYYYSSNYYSALEYYMKALALNEENDNLQGIANCTHNIGLLYYKWNNSDKALEYLKLSAESEIKIGNYEGAALTYNTIGNTYQSLSDFKTSLEYYNKALAIGKKYDNDQILAEIFNNIGVVYKDWNDLDNSLMNYERALHKFISIGDRTGEAKVLNNIGQIYEMKFGQEEKALEYFEKSLIIKKELQNRADIVNTLSNIANIYFVTRNYKKALDKYNEALLVANEIDNDRGTAMIYKNIGDLWTERGELKKAEEVYFKSLIITKDLKWKSHELDTYFALSEMYEISKRFSKSLEYYKKYNELEELIFNENRALKVIELQTKFENTIKEKELEKLNNVQKINELNLIRNNQKIASQKKLIIFFSILLFFLSIIVLVLIRYSRHKKIANAQLEKSHAEITTQKVELNEYKNQLEILVEKRSKELYDEINERTKTEDTLRVSEERFRLLFEKSPDAIFLENFDGNIIDVNHAACRLYGRNSDELIGKNVRTLLTAEERGNLLVDYNKIAQNDVNYNKDYLFATDTRSIPVEIRASKINYSGTDVLMLLIRDVTERKIFEKKLIKSKEKAEESDRLKSAFLSNMSHEIRTPMNAIIGFSDLLNQPELTIEQREDYIGFINRNGNALLGLIDDIIDLSKIEAGELDLRETRCNINNILDDIYLIFDERRRKSEKNKIELIYNKEGFVDNLCVNIDELRLKQVLMNLLGNALKYTDSGYVKFGYIVESEDIKFYVEDTGIGLSEEEKNHVFERFWQAKVSKSKVYEGTGLGLSISQGIVERIGGEIWLESQQGKGSIFYFTIPSYKSDIVDVEKEEVEIIETDYNWQHKNILVAEDQETNFLLINEILSLSNANIFWAKDGQEAIDYCENENIDLVLMDIKMPNVDGYSATKAIKKLNKNIPVIVQTAFAMKSEREAIIDTGCDDFLIKPLRSKQLLGLMSKYLN